MQATYILEHLPEGAEINFEAFAGSPDDPNAALFFAGAWDLLLPKVNDGTFTVPSGKAPKSNEEWKLIGIQGWTSASAQAEMENRLNSFYTGGKKVNVILSPNDSLALGIAQALEGAGYAPGADYPILTGQDADVANTKNVLAGRQAMTVWKDTRLLADRVAKMSDQILRGQEVELNSDQTFNNGVKEVPFYLLDPQVVTKDTVESALVDSGFYTKEQLGL